ncbi:MAG: RelA/SpoT domain-containing protein, partial [Acidobacteriota bacterium]
HRKFDKDRDIPSRKAAMDTLNQDEVERIKAVVTDSSWRRNCLQLQKIIFDDLESFARSSGKKFIRTVIPRADVKELGSILKKIVRKRTKEGKPDYAFDHMEDCIGIKVVTPYISEIIHVVRYLFMNPSFKITPTVDLNNFDPTANPALVFRDTGYRGHHFTVRLQGQLLQRNPEARGVCEVQIKTILEEGWDAKTHDVSFKPRGRVAQELERHMKLVSDALNVIDQQSEVIKDQIKAEETRDLTRREAAVLVYLVETGVVPLLTSLCQKLQERGTLVAPGADLQSSVQEVALGPVVQEELLRSLFTEVLEYERSLGQDVGVAERAAVCQLAALLAVRTKDLYMNVMAGELGKKLLDRFDQDPIAWNVA